MPRLLVFQHVAFEILGTLNPLLKKSGFRMRYVNFEREPEAIPNVDGYHGLVVLGGPMNADQTDAYPHLATEVDAIRRAIERNIPVLGICLGAQLIARALGASVAASPEKEIGWYDVSVSDAGREDPLFAHFARTERIFQWHSDSFEIPHAATQLASSASCPNQAFRYGDRVYGFQFHMEVDEPLIERWLNVPVHQEEIRALGGRIDPDRIRAETRSHIPPLKRLARQTFAGFIELFGDD